MKKLIPLFLFAILVFVTYQNASALTLNAIPQKQEFGPNEWIKVDLAIQGYTGGDIKWVAHRPDNSVISGTVLQQVKAGKTMHQIVRDAYDSEFGPWSIDYQYGGINYTAHFNVGSLNLAVFMDKATYYEPDIMNINITSSFYDPYAKFAKSYYLNFYDREGNPALGAPEIEIKGDRPSVSYHYQMLLLAKYNPPGLYKLKVQYFNSVVEIPFLLGNIQKLMQVSIQSKTASYYPGDDVTLDLLVTRVTQSAGVITITDPSGNTTSIQFPVNSVHSTLSIKDITKKIGIYKFNVQYAGVKNSGTFNVVTNINQLPKIDLDLYLNKWNYRKGEIVEARVYTS
ncbi:MAG TPA: hypothetical protein VFP45_03095, partial [Candidatus Nitrosotalea sp.]|nr:hypothetical protein [Candidatus Nitrosotalea sp.]